MAWSGTLIYWANDIYHPFFPKWVYQSFDLHHRLALGMAVHFFLMWFFTFNGLLYVLYLLISGEWRSFRLRKGSFREAWQYLLFDLGFRKSAPPYEKYNPTQKLAYLGVLAMGILSILSGLAIYKPVQLSWLTSVFLGYEGARFTHFVLYLGYGIFFGMHLIQVGRAGWNSFRSMISGYEKLGKNEKKNHQ
jgi:thiosulfate reductase cytochrome b subunit